MRRNVWTVLAVFVCIFAMAWGLNAARSRTLGSERASISRGSEEPGMASGSAEPTGARPDAEESPGDVSARTSSEALPSPAMAAATASAGEAARTAEHQIVPPAVDTILRNPPNGMLFAGHGKFQLYRQGDITWRLDTDTGQACILFATDERWRQERVFEHGCATR